jgi:hypothetical protein
MVSPESEFQKILTEIERENYLEALNATKHMMVRFPDRESLHTNLTYLLSLVGDSTQISDYFDAHPVKAYCEKFAARYFENVVTLLIFLGDIEFLDEVLENVRQMTTDDYVYFRAITQVERGEFDVALKFLLANTNENDTCSRSTRMAGRMCLSSLRFDLAYPRLFGEARIAQVKRIYKNASETIKVVGDQGVGDQLFYSRFLKATANHFHKISFDFDRRLTKFLGLAGLESCDGHEPTETLKISELLLLFVHKPDDIQDYLPARAPESVEMGGTETVGISNLSAAGTNSRLKSTSFEKLMEIHRARGGSSSHGTITKWIDMNYVESGHRPKYIVRPEGVDINNDLSGSVELASKCNALLTVSNTNAHLWLSSGLTTGVVLRPGISTFWYWNNVGGVPNKTPWYPCAELKYM